VDLDNAGPNEIKSDCDYPDDMWLYMAMSRIWQFNDEFVAMAYRDVM